MNRRARRCGSPTNRSRVVRRQRFPGRKENKMAKNTTSNSSKAITRWSDRRALQYRQRFLSQRLGIWAGGYDRMVRPGGATRSRRGIFVVTTFDNVRIVTRGNAL